MPGWVKGLIGLAIVVVALVIAWRFLDPNQTGVLSYGSGRIEIGERRLATRARICAEKAFKPVPFVHKAVVSINETVPNDPQPVRLHTGYLPEGCIFKIALSDVRVSAKTQNKARNSGFRIKHNGNVLKEDKEYVCVRSDDQLKPGTGVVSAKCNIGTLLGEVGPSRQVELQTTATRCQTTDNPNSEYCQLEGTAELSIIPSE